MLKAERSEVNEGRFYLGKSDANTISMTSLGCQGLVCGGLGATVQQSNSGVYDQSSIAQDNLQDDGFNAGRGTHNMERVSVRWKEIQDIRGLVTRNRLELRERRVELRQERGQARELEAQLWRNFQNFWDGNTGLDKSTIDPLYLEINKIRDELGPKEESYNEFEDDLDTLEYRLEQKESRFYSRFEKTYREDKFQPSLTDSSDGSHPAWSHGSTSDHTDNSSSPSNRYLSKIGDATIIRERLSELEAEQLHYLDVERERDALGYPLYQPNVEFLNTYPEVRAQYLEELRRIEEDLRTLGKEAGIPEHILDDETSSSASHGVPSRPASLQDVSPSSASIQVTAPPRRRSDGDLSHDTQHINPRTRINQWILEVLTNSPLERARHQAILDNPELNDSAWLRLVREYWKKDPAAWLTLIRKYWEEDHATSSLNNSVRGDGSLHPASSDTAHPESDPGAESNTTYSNISHTSGEHALKRKTNKGNPGYASKMILESVDQLF